MSYDFLKETRDGGFMPEPGSAKEAQYKLFLADAKNKVLFQGPKHFSQANLLERIGYEQVVEFALNQAESSAKMHDVNAVHYNIALARTYSIGVSCPLPKKRISQIERMALEG